MITRIFESICKSFYITLFTLFVSTFSIAQNLVVQELQPPESKQYSDLDFLSKELAHKRVVMLGEMTHQFGNIFEMKARVVEYLHQKLGFTTIAIESSMYDIWKMYEKGDFNASTFNNSVFGAWSDTEEFQRLVQYIEANNIKVIGFDSQIINTDQFIDDFFDFYEDKKIKITLDEEDMAIAIEALLNEYIFEEYDIKFENFEKELIRLLDKTKSTSYNTKGFYWYQFTKNLLSMSRDAYHNKKSILSTDFVNGQHNYRDEQMSDNLLSYLESNSDEKVVVWADNVHLIKNMNGITKPVVKEFIPMGYYIAEQLGDQMYSLATLHANDSLIEKGQKYATPILKGSFEEELTSFDRDYMFVSANQESLKRSRDHRLLSYIDFTKGRLDQMFDGYLFLRKATLPKTKSNNKIKIEAIDKEVSETSKTVLRKAMITKEDGVKTMTSRVIDATTYLPVVYATIILKHEEIYRITDENGYFTIPINNKIFSNSLVSISSMGFVSKAIPIKSLKSKVLLEPSVESLDAVQITAHLTPKSVLKKAVKQIKINHPIDPFNYSRYSNIKINQNDTKLLDLDLITAEYDQGYRQRNRLTQRVDQVQWNTNLYGRKLKNTKQLFKYRQNAIRYSNIVHRRKYKKFDLKFVKSKDPKDEDFYIIEFSTHRNNWNYTNRGYPSKYFGRIYIHKDNFAITKVIENWETSLSEEEILEYGFYVRVFEDLEKIKNIKLKEENVCAYTIGTNGKYYASEFFTRSYSEYLDKKNRKTNYTYELDSKVFDLKTEDVEVVSYDYYNEDESRLNRVKYNPTFWHSFLAEQY